MALRDRAIAVAASLLEDARAGRRAVTGTRAGRKIWFHVVGKGWRVEAASAVAPYVLEIVRRADHMYRVDADDRASLPTGEPGFDACFAVSGAPTVLVGGLLGPALRDQIRGLAPVGLRADRGRVSLAKSYAYYYAEPADIELAIELVVGLATRLEAVAADAEHRALRAGSGSGAPFRGCISSGAAAETRALQVAEVEHFLAGERRQRRRERRRIAVGVSAGFGWLAFNLAMALVGG